MDTGNRIIIRAAAAMVEEHESRLEKLQATYTYWEDKMAYYEEEQRKAQRKRDSKAKEIENLKREIASVKAALVKAELE